MDPNLKLLALNSLYLFNKDQSIKEKIDSINVSVLHKLVLGDDPKYGWYDCIPEIAKELNDIEISDEQLSKITILSGEACHVHGMIMPNWDGEGEEFDIGSLSGIEKMTSLKTIEFINFAATKDAALLLETNIEKISEFAGLSEDIKNLLSEKGVKLD